MQLEGYRHAPVTLDGVTRPVHRIGEGPAVIVVHEIPGITPKVAEFGRRIADRGMTAVLPELMGTAGKEPSAPYLAAASLRLCISRELAAFATNRTAPVIDWLRALARAEHDRCGGAGVGAVGMCYSGGFALGMMVDPSVVAPVLSQPSLPLGLTRSAKSSLQLSPDDLATVKERVDGGCPVLGLRFTHDSFVPEERFDTLRRELGDGFIAVELDSSPGNPHGHPGNAHSVLTEHLVDEPGTPTRAALDRVLDFFAERLQVA